MRIQPSTGLVSLRLGELWAYRELIFFLTWRDIKVRYKQTVLGVAWAILQPFFTMIVFSVFFGRIAGLSSDGIPRPIFYYAGLLPWNYFSQSLSQASNSLVGSSSLIRKVFFPRLIIPIANVIGGLVDFAVAFLLVIVMMIYYRDNITLSWNVLYLPLLMLLALVTALGFGMWFSAFNVHYRDIRYTVPFIVQFWLFVTPVIYPASSLPERWRLLLAVNPMAGVVEGFRWALLGAGQTPGIMLVVSSGVAIVVLISGLYYFRRMEKTFADVV